jgi:hypothetical protein
MSSISFIERLYHEIPTHLKPLLPSQDTLTEAITETEKIQGPVEIHHPTHLCWLTLAASGYLLINQDEPKLSLGKGSYSKNVYAATLICINKETPLKLRLAAINKITTESFSAEPYHLLAKVPRSPYLGGRPIGAFISTKKVKYVYLVQQRLTAAPLHLQLQAITDSKIQRSLFLKGMMHIAHALQLLHEHHYIHRDIKLDNATDSQLFDYDTLCSEEKPYKIKGARPDVWPPELIIPCYHKNPTHPEILKRYEELKTYDSEAFEELCRDPVELPLVDGILAFTFHPSFDIFILGMQFVKIYGHPVVWDEAHPLFNIKSLIESMIDFNKEKRPTALNVITELSKLF